MRLLPLLALLSVAASAAPPNGLAWIAHRGGVVGEQYAENSPASLEAAVRHGYWMIEADIRETRDHQIITHHDPDFRRFYGDNRKVLDLTLAEVRKLRAQPGGTPPMTFRELVDACRGRLQLMLDVKGPDHSPAFYQELERELKRTGLLQSAYIIGLDGAREFFKGKARVSANLLQLRAAVDRGEKVSSLYFLFEWGKTLDAAAIEFARKHNVTVVPSVNTFHYGRDMAESLRRGSEDIKRMISFGVTEYQIDSVYESAFQ